MYYHLQQGECVGTVITSVQTYNMTECLENCALVTGCTWVTVYYDVPYCKIFSTCDGGVNPVTCPNCLSSELSSHDLLHELHDHSFSGEAAC